jgi:two-component system, NarL family, sensor histidine kinase EvgS
MHGLKAQCRGLLEAPPKWVYLAYWATIVAGLVFHAITEGASPALLIAVLLLVAGSVRVNFALAAERRGRLRAELRNERVADSVPGGLSQFRVASDGSIRYEYFSAGCERLHDVASADALRDSNAVLETIVHEDRSSYLKDLDEAGRSLSRVECDYRVMTPGSEIQWVRTVAAPRRGYDGSIVWNAFASDATRRKKLESELQDAKEAADAANQAKSTFLATMSHEVRTPMNGVLGMLELLAFSDLTADQRATLNIVRQSGLSLLRIIDDILDFSKIEAGKLDLQPEPASLRNLVEGVRDIYSGNASRKGLVLRVDVDPRISAALFFDPVRLQQILNNLVSNAIKFTDEGEVEVRADLLESSAGTDVVRLSVRDTGEGVPLEKQATIFQPFVQAASARSGGTGLGLSIAQSLAHSMDSVLRMESRPGAGTTMALEVRLKISHDVVASTALMAPLPSDALVEMLRLVAHVPTAPRLDAVLIVDDNPMNRLVLQKQLESLGYAVTVARSGAEAVERWRDQRFAALLTDVNMPDMDGYELAKRIRQDDVSGENRAVIIACTANALPGERQKCLAAGMDDYLSKPMDLRQLSEMLRKWVPTASKASDQPVACNEVLNRAVLAEVAGVDGEREVLSRFRSFQGIDVRELRGAFDAGDLPRLHNIVHRMRGSAAAIGARGVLDACRRVEAAICDKDLSSIASSLSRLHDQLTRLDACLDAMGIHQPLGAT